ncbi:ComEA family DNA-binding protein [Actinoplanes couchii]|uniref:ComEA family DNA-binding protein n=1 Tax=Actinoplanes couchii TaxID=403638 RepID=UPI001EF162FD|nr:ComEA family DNA-binding protein [Actinoplanes couchii]MDR6323061.1 competence protein ComEA [Actinoplanes couchii]
MGSGGLPGFSGRWEAADPVESGGPGLSSAGAFESTRRQWLDAFDPGRPGVRALTAVAVVVVLVAAFLAWRSRPRLDEVTNDPGGSVAVGTGAGGANGAADPNGAAGLNGAAGVNGGANGAAGANGVSGAAGVNGAVGGNGGPGASAAEVVVAVGGKVRKPGLVRLSPGARVADALEAAGGALPGVDVAVLNLARRVTDGELIMVGVTLPPGTTTAPPAPAPGNGATGAAGSLVNLNTATLADLDTLPGVGPVLAQRILDARDAQGGFKAVSDLRKVDGIGYARYEQLKDLVTV